MNMAMRNALVFTLALGAALLGEAIFPFLQTPWFLLAASLSALSFLGPTLRQGFISVVILIALALGGTLVNGSNITIFIALIGWLLLGIIFYCARPCAPGLFIAYWPTCLATFAVLLFPVFKVEPIAHQLAVILLGSLVGLISNLLIYRGSFANLFSRAILPPLRQLHHLVGAQSFSSSPNQPNNAAFAPWFRAMHVLLHNYPHWIYYVGFNPGLRAGTRHFLIQLSRAFDACLTAQFYATKVSNEHAHHDLNAAFERVRASNAELVQILIDYFATSTIPATQTDWVSDLAELEMVLKSYITVDITVLEMVPEQLALVSTLHHVSDLRRALLELARALPPPPKPRYTV